MSQSVTEAVALRKGVAADMILTYKPRFALILPSHLNAETFTSLALGALRNEDLAKAAKNNPGALMVALTQCARLGHQPNTEAFYLVPFKNVITGIEGYRGVVERLYRSGGVSSVHARVVRANDEYIFEEGMKHPVHKYDRFAPDARRGDRIGVYAYAKLRDGSYSQVIEMNRDAVMARKAASNSSASSYSPWQKWEDSMWLKCPTRELEKWVPSSAEYREQFASRSSVAAELVAEAAPDAPGDVLDGEIVDADWPATAPAGDAA